MRHSRLSVGMFVVGVAALVMGCGTSPEPHFYTLTAAEHASRKNNATVVEGSRFAVGPVTLPEMVDRPELVVRVGANQVALVEQHRWAEPLRSEVARVLAENLGELLSGSQVVTYPYNASRDVDYRVIVDIQRFDSILGQTVTIDALWAVRRVSGGGEPISGRSVAREPTGGNGYDALVAAHGRALAGISGEIAEAIRIAVPQRLTP